MVLFAVSTLAMTIYTVVVSHSYLSWDKCCPSYYLREKKKKKSIDILNILAMLF